MNISRNAYQWIRSLWAYQNLPFTSSSPPPTKLFTSLENLPSRYIYPMDSSSRKLHTHMRRVRKSPLIACKRECCEHTSCQNVHLHRSAMMITSQAAATQGQDDSNRLDNGNLVSQNDETPNGTKIISIGSAPFSSTIHDLLQPNSEIFVFPQRHTFGMNKILLPSMVCTGSNQDYRQEKQKSSML